MSIILFISTFAMILAGLAFSLAYIWINAFSDRSDLKTRNNSIIRMTRTTMILSLIFALVSGLFAKTANASAAISRTVTLYSAIAISWLIVLLACGCVAFISFVSKSRFKEGLLPALKRLFTLGVIGAALGTFFAWLFG
ncbi:MAG: hypothetical protein IJM50_01000 [Lachnospiraceae bacterium]|nr:hypothetical protein [Lachnospiraceae bacterium]